MSGDELCDVLSPVLAASGLELFDVEVGAGLVRVTVDRPGGVDLDALAAANRTVSAVLDDVDPFSGRYTLEVSSPGLERRLRVSRHFLRSLGATVSVRTRPGAEQVRRVTGRLVTADDDGFELEGTEVPGGRIRLAYAQVERARTIFEWASPRPKASSGQQRGRGGRSRPAGRSPASGNVTTERVTTS